MSKSDKDKGWIENQSGKSSYKDANNYLLAKTQLELETNKRSGNEGDAYPHYSYPKDGSAPHYSVSRDGQRFALGPDGKPDFDKELNKDGSIKEKKPWSFF